MGTRYLTDMANWLRSAGVAVVEYDGWKNRARSSGGYEPDRPWCIMWHHTASKTSPENDASYMCHGSGDKPIANILLARDGTAWVLAAGATNTNGKGQGFQTSRGRVPADSMNTYAVGIEIANNGVGESYPQEQIDAAFAISLELCKRLGLQPADACEHQFYAPDRKIDPATGDAVDGPWLPREINSSGTWNQDDLHDELNRRAGMPLPPGPGPDPVPEPGPPGPPIGEDEKSMVVALDGNGTAWIGDGMDRYTPTEDDFNVKVLLANDDVFRFVNTQGERVQGWQNVHTVGDNVIAALGRWGG